MKLQNTLLSLTSALSLAAPLSSAAQVPLKAPTMAQKHDSQHEFRLADGPGTFSPYDMLTLPRPGTGIANQKGDLAYVSVSQYSFKEKTTNKTIYIAPLQSTVIPPKLPFVVGGDAFWLDDRTIGHVVEGKGDNKDSQELWAVSLTYSTEPSSESLVTVQDPPVHIGSFPSTTKLTNFKFSPGASVLVFSAYTFDDFDLTAVKELDSAWDNRGTTAMVYDELFIRHWDTWSGPKKSSLFAIDLSRDGEGKWSLGPNAWSLQRDTKHYTPVEPFGGAGDFDVSDEHVIYTTKDPSVNPAWHTRQDIYTVPIKVSAQKINPHRLTSGKQGATSSPVFSKDGKQAAWLEQAEDGFEADKNQIAVYDLKKNEGIFIAPKWDRSPDSLMFSLDGKYLYMTVGDEGRIKVYTVTISTSSSTTPIALTERGAASGPVQPLPHGRLLFTRNDFRTPNNLYVLSGLSAPHHSEPLHLEKVTRFGSEIEEKNIKLDEGEEFWFEGAAGRQIQGWALKPKGWNEAKEKGEPMQKRWPVLLLIHGGPEGAWEDQWSTRWNLNVFAQQGYFTLLINPTGSTTFGQKLTRAISKDWGGAPFVDLKKGWDYALQTWPEIDPNRAAALGASYGGYSINWIQSHPEWGFNFKALVCHDGVFDTRYTMWATDEYYFSQYEFGGLPWEKAAKENAEKWNPLNLVDKWSTPQLIIHGGKDYRLTDTEGIAAFGALQARGIESRLVYFPDENHWVLNAGNSLKWHLEVFRWLDRFVGKGASAEKILN